MEAAADSHSVTMNDESVVQASSTQAEASAGSEPRLMITKMVRAHKSRDVFCSCSSRVTVSH